MKQISIFSGKTAFILILSLLSFISCKPVNEFRIHGTVLDPKLDGVQIFLVPLKNAVSENIDSVYIKEGHFEFKGNTERISDIRVDKKHRIGIQNLLVITEPGDIYVTIGSRSTGGGTPQNDSLQVWKELTEARNAESIQMKKEGLVNKSLQRRAEYRVRTRQMAHNVGDSTTLGKFFLELFPESLDAK